MVKQYNWWDKTEDELQLHKKYNQIALDDPTFLPEFPQSERVIQLKTMMINARTQANLTQLQLAKKMRMSRARVAQLERDPSRAKKNFLMTFFKACGVQFKVE